MRPSFTALTQELTRARGCLSLRHHPELKSQAARAASAGLVFRPLPSVIAHADLANDPATLMRAAVLHDPGVIFLGRSAARLLVGPTFPSELTTVDVAHRYRGDSPAALRFHCYRPPQASLEIGRSVMMQNCDAAALWAAERGDFDVAFHGFRDQLITRSSLRSMAESGHERRCGAWISVAWLLRGEPWSHPELELHEMMRARAMRGWAGNHRVRVAGKTYFIDIAFPLQRLAVEVDSRQHHSTLAGLERDQRRQNTLVNAGWKVLRFSPLRIATEGDRRRRNG